MESSNVSIFQFSETLIVYRLCTIVCKCLHGRAPSHLTHSSARLPMVICSVHQPMDPVGLR